MVKILAFAGSLREKAYSKRVLNVAIEGARDAGAEVTVIDLRDYPLPLFNADEYDKAFDANALALQDIFAGHDGFLLSSPEYNGSMPGGMKNMIDWVSRPSEKYSKSVEVFKGKTAAIIASSPGSFGGIRCLSHIRGMFSIMFVTVLPVEIAVSFVGQKFEGDSDVMTDEKMKKVLMDHGASLIETIKRNWSS
jgi:chromate reductase, NAD(P)H dehydrogenase (quinone)